MEYIGWASTSLLGICGACYALKPRKIDLFYWVWLLGEILGLVYAMYLWKLPLLANYGFNAILLGFVYIRRIR